MRKDPFSGPENQTTRVFLGTDCLRHSSGFPSKLDHGVLLGYRQRGLLFRGTCAAVE